MGGEGRAENADGRFENLESQARSRAIDRPSTLSSALSPTILLQCLVLTSLLCARLARQSSSSYLNVLERGTDILKDEQVGRCPSGGVHPLL